MRGRDPLTALEVTDPMVAEDPTRDDALLARILADPLGEGPPVRSRRARVAVLVGAPLVLATGALAYDHLAVDDAGLRPLALQARRSVPLPVGAHWSPLPPQILGANTYTDGPVMARHLALLEAQCHWERAWLDGRGDPSRLAAAENGYAANVDRMRSDATMAEDVAASDEAGAAARAGDAQLLEQDLAVNCTPEMGGTATTLSVLERSLAESGRPAVALVLARRADARLPDEADSARFQALAQRINDALAQAGASPDPGNVDSLMLGRDYLTARFHVTEPRAAVAVIRRLARGEHPLAGSFLLLWTGPGDSARVPLGSSR